MPSMAEPALATPASFAGTICCWTVSAGRGMFAYLLKLLENLAIRSAASAQLARTLFISCIATFLTYRCLLH